MRPATDPAVSPADNVAADKANLSKPLPRASDIDHPYLGLRIFLVFLMILLLAGVVFVTYW